MYYVELALAIVMELLGTNLMKLSNGFSRLWFALGTFVAYGCCFFFLSLSLRGIKLNVAYATWGGAGIVLATVVSYFIFHEGVSGLQLLGISLIVVGVVLANVAGTH
ncbi:DMT family transporter [Limosilactobacillus difficilis]|uniref:DMT family transporter n=1 Tax=Limosilactobacillus difficilis TaxID=2991838 RepID=UPI0038CC1A13